MRDRVLLEVAEVAPLFRVGIGVDDHGSRWFFRVEDPQASDLQLTVDAGQETWVMLEPQQVLGRA